MKSTPGYGYHHFNMRAEAQERHSMGKTMSGKGGGKFQHTGGSMKTVKRVAGGKVNSK